MFWQIACDALKAGLCLEVRHRERIEIVEVHAVGESAEGFIRMYAWQIYSTKTGDQGRWRLFKLDPDGTYELSVMRSLAPRPDYHRDARFPLVHCQV